jgi:hypothetical protein
MCACRGKPGSNRSFVLHVDGTRKLKSVSIDPSHALPDVERGNNTFVMP